MRTIMAISIIGLMLTGCGKKADQKAPDSATATSQINDQQLLAKASEILIRSFGKELKSELMAALNEGGPVTAINTCEVRAPEIATAHTNQFWSIKRVSDRNRNPENLADNIEMSVMRRFTDSSQTPPEYIVGWAPADDGKIYRHYRPIKIAPLCRKCHGMPDDIDETVQAALTEKYPYDRAIGYTDGDLRGIFVVEVRWPEGRTFADSLIAASESTESGAK